MDAPEDRTLAVELFNRCWELLETDSRTVDDDVELLSAAFTSRFHWQRVGEPEQRIVSDWMVARVLSTLGVAETGLLFAQRAYDAAQAAPVPDWLVASTAEGLARAYAASGQVQLCQRWIATASQLVDEIADAEDRKLIASQLATVWID